MDLGAIGRERCVLSWRELAPKVLMSQGVTESSLLDCSGWLHPLGREFESLPRSHSDSDRRPFRAGHPGLRLEWLCQGLKMATPAAQYMAVPNEPAKLWGPEVVATW